MTAPQVDNELYRRLGHSWWDDEVGEFSTIRFFVNPVRFSYFERVLRSEATAESPLTLLDVGCGGGMSVALVEAAEQRRARTMAKRRKKHGLSQTQVAAKMEISPSIVSRIESAATCGCPRSRSIWLPWASSSRCRRAGSPNGAG